VEFLEDLTETTKIIEKILTEIERFAIMRFRKGLIYRSNLNYLIPKYKIIETLKWDYADRLTDGGLCVDHIADFHLLRGFIRVCHDRGSNE